jgi:predicted DNA-binding helix-hairpin-helix protein
MARQLSKEIKLAIVTGLAYSSAMKQNHLSKTTQSPIVQKESFYQADSLPIIRYNNIKNNEKYNIYLSNIKNDLNASLNWWGTTDTVHNQRLNL